MNIEREFQYLYFLQENSIQCDDAMVKCGLDALADGFEGPEVCTLAASEGAEGAEVRRQFRLAADEVGVSLPEASDQRAWLIRMADSFEREGRKVPSRSTDARVNDALVLIRDHLRRRATGIDSESLQEYERHLAVLTDRGGPDDYEDWYKGLKALRDQLLDSSTENRLKEAVHRTTELVGSIAYGAAAEVDLAESWAIRRLLEEVPENPAL